MKRFTLLTIMFCLLFIGSSYTANAQTKAEVRAKAGEPVMIIINTVKDESKADYEKFMEDVFYKLVTTSTSEKMAEQHQKTRRLAPQRQNKDGSWTYAFIMDPYVEGGNYQFEALFEEQYSKEEAAALIQQHNSYMAAPPVFYNLEQTKY